MSPAILLAEIALLTTLLCGAHALKPRLGMAPLYTFVGLVVGLLFLMGNAHPDGSRISAAIYGSEAASLATLFFFPLLLSAMVLVYVLEGTRAARRLLVGIAFLYFVHGLVDVLAANHAAHPPVGLPAHPDSPLVAYNLRSRLASLVAVCVDFFVILTTYQFVVNRLQKLPRVPLAVPVFVALVAAMVADGIVYNAVSHGSLSINNLWIMEKLQTGMVAGVPLSLYLGFQLSRHKTEVRHGILNRGTLAVFDLRQQVEAMSAELESMRQMFGRYVSEDVVTALLADPRRLKLGGEEREVTILFADIRGYSTLAEALQPTEVIELLNRYFQRVTGVILDRQGMINEFEGDAVLAVFGAPLDVPNHAELAVNSALAMLDAVRDLNAEFAEDGTAARWRAVGIDGLAIRIGIHSGKVVAGNIGSEVRTKYAVIGDTVNTASRVEGLNKQLQTSMLLTSTTRRALMEECRVLPPLVDMGTHLVKGRTEPVRVFTVENAYPFDAGQGNG
ncbi:MAG: class 3 adenylate cyclase [Myxococcota bacterium]